ncbi:MAG: hypothetical protein ABEJ03_04815 [Candidatus Nanohaloarchaea archaeon]
MEQNLSEKERKQRLALGVVFGLIAIGSYVTSQSIYLTAGLAAASLGFIVNYFTCFCGTKKAIKSLKNRF